ncbi:hypothetical protein CIB48_g5626 [Xylaria polymorpha]|nr:hypothetical protein CIB48_g5626 [Xylaria polymorpha]
MVNLTAIIASNERISSALPPGLVAVFVGGTSGVGEYTLQAFARYARAPKVIIVGRSREAADRILEECRGVNPEGCFEFVRGDVSLLRNVETGAWLFNRLTPTSETSEGLPHNQRPSNALARPLHHEPPPAPTARGVSAARRTGFPLLKWRDQIASIGTLLLEEAQRRAPDVAFVHTVPGVVRSGIMRDVQPTLRLSIIIAVSRLLAPLINVPPAECGERHVFAATSAAFAPAEGAGGAGVPLVGMAAARGTDGRVGSGVYSLSQKLDPALPKVEEVLRRFREDGTARKVCDAVAADFKRIYWI